jgi:hypothetical protein
MPAVLPLQPFLVPTERSPIQLAGQLSSKSDPSQQASQREQRRCQVYVPKPSRFTRHRTHGTPPCTSSVCLQLNWPGQSTRPADNPRPRLFCVFRRINAARSVRYSFHKIAPAKRTLRPWAPYSSPYTRRERIARGISCRGLIAFCLLQRIDLRGTGTVVNPVPGPSPSKGL